MANQFKGFIDNISLIVQIIIVIGALLGLTGWALTEARSYTDLQIEAVEKYNITVQNDTIKRLDRIENKLDRMLEK